jgi:uncharacterized protein
MRLMILSGIVTILAFACLCSVWPRFRRGRACALFWGAACAVFVFWAISRGLNGRLALPAGWLVSTWVMASAASILLALGWLAVRPLGVRFAHWYRNAQLRDRASSLNTSRRRFLSSSVALPGVAISIGAGGAFEGASEFAVRRVELQIRNLPQGLDGFRIGQISDVHIGDFVRPQYLARAVDAMNDAHVDLQVMTGDLIDDLSLLDATFAALGRCRAPHGMLAVLGNHEKFRGLGSVLDAYARHRDSGPVRLLVDENIVLDQRGVPLRVVGVDFPMRGTARVSRQEERDALMRVSAEKAFRGVAPGETVLCLTHHPEFFPFAAERGAAVTLAGHTHGGQVAVLGRALLQTYRYMRGHYRRGAGQLYVSSGTGHWLPFRLGVPTEVTILTLRAA